MVDDSVYAALLQFQDSAPTYCDLLILTFEKKTYHYVVLYEVIINNNP